MLIILVCLINSWSFAEWMVNTDFPLIGDSHAAKGGTVRYAIPSYPATFQIHGPSADTTFNSLMGGLVYQTLVRIHPNTLEMITGLPKPGKSRKTTRPFFLNLKPVGKTSATVTPEDVVFLGS